MHDPAAHDSPHAPLLERFQGVIFGALFLAIVGGVAALVWNRPAPVEIVVIPPAPTATAAPTQTPAPVRVYVSGAVNRPGVYTLPWGALAQDALVAAGGAQASADLRRVNLARALRDGDQVDVPEQGTVSAPAESVERIGPVNLNTATLEELDSLPGIGPALAGRIIAYREANGGFSSVEQIVEVSGIGATLLERLVDYLTVE